MALKRSVFLLATAVLACAAGSTARAVSSGEVIVDEHFNGFYQDALGNAPVSLPSTLAIDPLSGINALRYDLGPIGAAPVNGDVLLTEPPTGGLSDVLRFETIGGHPYLFFYSDTTDGADSPADVTPLGQLALQSNQVSAAETGLIISLVPPNNRFSFQDAVYVEDATNGLNYLQPTSTQPGFDNGFKVTNYHFISDGAVPEPASLGILGMGAAGLLVRRKRK